MLKHPQIYYKRASKAYWDQLLQTDQLAGHGSLLTTSTILLHNFALIMGSAKFILASKL